MRVIVMKIAGASYAVPMTQLREVVVGPRVSPLPTAPATVLGLMNLRGDVIPVVDGHTLLGSSAASTRTPQVAVVVDTRVGSCAAIAVDERPDTADLGDLVQEAETVGGEGVYRIGDDVAVLLHLPTVLANAGLALHGEDPR